ncbi:unnamed protein product [Cylicocyclus nassatus]|uniref:Uncharacterized protein n=1 Tax=Cylicocyclus nassatus TaxID=53992 RepID=A0AA36GLY7_CYLNA|nr:unnamed protein product [Cylicocyclus nassatus]
MVSNFKNNLEIANPIAAADSSSIRYFLRASINVTTTVNQLLRSSCYAHDCVFHRHVKNCRELWTSSEHGMHYFNLLLSSTSCSLRRQPSSVSLSSFFNSKKGFVCYVDIFELL